MSRFSLSTLRTRLLLLALLAGIPTLSLAFYTASAQRQAAVAKVQEDALRMARLAASNQEQWFQGALQLLVAFSRIPEVRRSDAAACSRLFSDLVKSYPYYTTFGVADVKGDLRCSSVPIQGRLNVADRDYIRRVLLTHTLAVSDYQVGRVTGKPSINLGYPFFNDAGEVEGVVVAGLDLLKLNEKVKESGLPSTATLTMLDRNGIVLVRYPDFERWIGRRAPESERIQEILSQGGEGEAPGAGGIPSLFGMTRLSGVGGEFYLSVAIPKEKAFADADRLLAHNLLWMGTVGLLVVMVTWAGGDRLILRRFDALVQTTVRLAGGDLTARTGQSEESGEIGQLARAFDKMAETLQGRVTQLREAEARYRALVEHIPAGTFVSTLDDQVLYISPQIERMFGIPAAVWMSEPRYWIKQIDPADRERVLAELQRFMTAGEPFVSDYRMQTAAGALLWVHAEAVVVQDETGRPYGIQGILLDITDRKMEAALLEHQALHDGLTDLPNRILLRDRLQQALLAGQREKKPIALLVMDLDRFKEVNDTLGHHYGDLLLKQLGLRLTALLRATTTVARLGGDEFALLLPGATAEGATVVVQKVLKALETPFLLEGQTVHIGASIGIALFPEHGADADLLLQRADVAMYAAKQSGSGYAMYLSERDPHSARRLAVSAGLRQAIQEDQLFLLYQPKIDLKSNLMIGVEALVRWQHPELGMIPPDQFIPLAEQTGLIKPLTLWVLNTALAQCRRWREGGREICVAVNLSARNLQDPELSDQVIRALEIHGVPPHDLELEITESILMVDPSRAMEILNRLTGHGVRFSIDDFGVGYSSLSYLKRLPVSAIKIDRSFVRDMDADPEAVTIVRSTIDLSHNLGRKVIAEGVETEAVRAQLASFGCDAAQGYYFSRPIPAADLFRWLDEFQRGLVSENLHRGGNSPGA
ncbi:MAG: EAL domain-containing protein [Nitrospirae bacterium]|nr:EAL domain-containing protein [Candidatus Manganitrophaceae bacterium]